MALGERRRGLRRAGVMLPQVFEAPWKDAAFAAAALRSHNRIGAAFCGVGFREASDKDCQGTRATKIYLAGVF